MAIILEQLEKRTIFLGSLSTVVGDEKLTPREGRRGLLFFYVCSDKDTLTKVNKVFKTEV